jgi:hypothetical protein
MEPGMSGIGIKFGAPVSKNINYIPVTTLFEPGRKRLENGLASSKLVMPADLLYVCVLYNKNNNFLPEI